MNTSLPQLSNIIQFYGAKHKSFWAKLSDHLTKENSHDA